MSLEEWRSTISENERRERLRQRIQQGEGERYMAEYAASQIPTAARQLSDFMASAEIAFMRRELAKHSYDQAALSHSYALSIPTTSMQGQGLIQWPASVFFLHAGDFTGPYSTAREFHAMTALGLTQFRHSYSLWSGPVLKVRPITPEAFVYFRAKYILGPHPRAAHSPWSDLYYKYDVQYSWEDWTQAVRQQVDSYLDGARGEITVRFSAFVSVK